MNIGVVIIGRNEGERLRQCFESISSTIDAVVYVDSGSTDHSILLAKEMNVSAIELDASIPFSAARGRNEGFDYLLEKYPMIQFVQFIDGDCTLAPKWIKAGCEELLLNTDCAAVVGHLEELHPESSLYNRLCALEWRSPAGDLTQTGGLGGISMMRASFFKQLEGFNSKVIAGEEPELGRRMALAGYKITKIDQQMAVHDADMHDFSQWWKRAVRSGHAIAQGAFLNGGSINQNCIRKRNSTWFWGVGLPLFTLITVIPTNGWSLFLLNGYLVLGTKVYYYYRKVGYSSSDSLILGISILVAKFAEAIGLLKFYYNHWKGHYEIIEYK